MKNIDKLFQKWANLPVFEDDDELRIGDHQVMQSWETPLMHFMAREVTETQGDVLEIGFGMGISAKEILNIGCKSYTVIENHPAIAEKARSFLRRRQTRWSVIEGSWQDVIGKIKMNFDGILFDTYPLHDEERSRNHFKFIPVAKDLLNPKGVLTYYSDETRRFRTEHMDILLSHFDIVKLIVVSGLRPFKHCAYWRDDHMVVPVAVKR